MAPRYTWLVLCLAGFGSVPGPALAQAGAEVPISYTRDRVFNIPFHPEPGERRLKEVQLYVSTDLGQTWHPYVNAPPDQGAFRFTADRDGWYWFAVRTLDQDGRAHPPTMDRAAPGLKVCVDTLPPAVDLRALASRDGEVGVAWDVRDDNLSPTTLRLEYHAAGAVEWSPVRAEATASGQVYWRPYAGGRLEARLQVRDLAGNEGSRTIALGGEGGVETRPFDSSPPSTAGRGTGNLPAPGDPAVRMVSSRRISLNYEIKEKGPSGVSAVELWYTQDGRSWMKWPENLNPNPPFVFDVHGEGLYGFTLVVRSGVGLGGNPPQVGDPPQIWVEVDETKPVVRLTAVDVGRGSEANRLTIAWEASDKNLARQPITLSYAESADGPWRPIASNLENSRRYVWQMPADVPYKFLVRVEAVDRAGNVGADQTLRPVIVDLAQPKGVILDVGPGK